MHSGKSISVYSLVVVMAVVYAGSGVTWGDEEQSPCEQFAQQAAIHTERYGNATQVTKGTTEDCNENGVPDADDIAGGVSTDCNFNGIPDECDLASGTSVDADGDSYPDECPYASLVPVVPPPPCTASYPEGVVISGNQIFLPQGEHRVWVELQIGHWAPEILKGWQVTLDPSGYSSGNGAPFGPVMEPCSAHPECEPTVGTDVCDGRCADGGVCNVSCSDGSECVLSYCKPGFQDCTRPDALFYAGLCDLMNRTTPRFRMAGIALDYYGIDDGVPHYAFNLVFDVPADGAGTYTLDIDPAWDPLAGDTESAIMYLDSSTHPFGYTKPLQITICSGSIRVPCTMPSGDIISLTMGCCAQAGGTMSVPAVSIWGMAILGLAVLIAARVYYSPRLDLQQSVC